MNLLPLPVQRLPQKQFPRIGIHLEHLVAAQRIGLEAISHQGILAHIRITGISLEDQCTHRGILRNPDSGIMQRPHKNRSMIIKVRDTNVQSAVYYVRW